MDRSLALRPPPGPTRAPKTISEFIQAANLQPGGFRLLRQKKNLPASDDVGEDVEPDVSMADADETDESSKPKDIVASRDALMRNIGAAQHTSTLTLEFLSLLLSKENPAQASATISNELRNLVGLGTLGATLLDSPSTIVKDRVADHKLTAIGKRLLAVNNAAENTRAAATRLQNEIALENKYWAEVMAVSDKGWSVFRLPQEPQTMGVKVGFSNAAPEFKAASIAPMRRSEDGSVRLEHGKLSGESKRLQVTIMEHGVPMGKSSLPKPLAEDAPFQDHVKDYRDTLFALELWHELNREGRTLLSRGVQLLKSALTFTIDDTKSVVLELVSLADDSAKGATSPGTEDDFAETISLTLHLLLCNAHRQNEIRRVEQSIPGANRGPPPPYALLLPVLTKYQHEQSIERCTKSMLGFIRVLRSAGLGSSFTITEPPIQPPAQAAPSEALLESLTNTTDIQFDLTITPETRVRISVKSSQKYGTRYAVSMPACAPGQSNPLSEWFPPDSLDPNSRLNDGMYSSADKLIWYLEGAIPRAITLHCMKIVQEFIAAETAKGRHQLPYHISPSGKRIMDADTGNFGMTFDFERNLLTAEPELNLLGSFMEEGLPTQRNYLWTTDSSNSPGNVEDLVRTILMNGPLS
ncbi:Subunit 17 of Mediator complex domain containing protein [Naviculisporaceae sp. PSN 640]